MFYYVFAFHYAFFYVILSYSLFVLNAQGGIIMEERLNQQLDFILEIDKEKNILRQTHLSGHGRREK